MRKVILGPPNSGKSLKGELLMLDYANSPIAYIATLPQISSTASRIQRHQLRRNSEWFTLEMDDDMFECIQILKYAFCSYSHVFMDGLSILVWRIAMENRSLNFDRAIDFLDRITHILDTTQADWILVDCVKPYPLKSNEDSFNQIMKRYHLIWNALSSEL